MLIPGKLKKFEYLGLDHDILLVFFHYANKFANIVLNIAVLNKISKYESFTSNDLISLNNEKNVYCGTVL